ncbi:MAG: DUF4918 family protein [Bacteroidota bacterium]|nr:DUF4918 family protein [Bacteroidota bacterium]
MTTQKNFAQNIISFYKNLKFNYSLPAGIEVMNPIKNKITFSLFTQFYTKYYSDNSKRVFIFGINPGRFGAGLTGVPFTDPTKLKEICGIDNNLSNKKELSAEFVYKVIAAYGGNDVFYSKFYITAVSPLGFIQDGLNVNYYDDKGLQEMLTPFIIKSIKKQLKFGVIRSHAICFGNGKNFNYLNKLNDKYAFFEEIIPIEHPRFIMQYKRKKLDEYVAKYLEILSQ